MAAKSSNPRRLTDPGNPRCGERPVAANFRGADGSNPSSLTYNVLGRNLGKQGPGLFETPWSGAAPRWGTRKPLPRKGRGGDFQR